MNVVLDAMGGDHAPTVNIDGALDTVQETDDIHVILVGAKQPSEKSSRAGNTKLNV